MQENEVSKSNKIKIIVLTAVIFLVSIAGISYAYFTIQITGNETASSMRLRTANMQLIYNDVQIVAGEYEQPGWSDTKTLTVQNTGNVTVYYNIIWRDLINEIINNELVISAECSSSTGTCDDINETVVPTKLTEAHNIRVKSNIEIAPGATHTYTLTALFKETGSNQNYNQNKYFNGTLNIVEGKEPPKRVGTDSTTGFPVVRIGTEEFYDITDSIDYDSLISTTGNIYNYASGKRVLLAKYNLYVGLICTESSSSSCTPISTFDSNYGKQSVDAKAGATLPAIGTVPLAGTDSSSGYWDPNGTGLNSSYGTYTNTANNIYNDTYSAAPDYSLLFYGNQVNSNYSVAYYIDEYMDRFGINGIGRLLTYPEANSLTASQRSNGADYWLGSAYNNQYTRFVTSAGGHNYGYFYFKHLRGVRPVIVVDSSDIQSS